MNCFDLLDDHVVGELFARMTFDEAWDLSRTCRRFLPRNPAPAAIALKSIARTIPFDSARLTELVVRNRQDENCDFEYSFMRVIHLRMFGAATGLHAAPNDSICALVLEAFLVAHGIIAVTSRVRTLNEHRNDIDYINMASDIGAEFSRARLFVDPPSRALMMVATRNRQGLLDLMNDDDTWNINEPFAPILASVNDPEAAEFYLDCAKHDAVHFAEECFLYGADAYRDLLWRCDEWDLVDRDDIGPAMFAPREARIEPRPRCQFIRITEQCPAIVAAAGAEFCSEHAGFVTVELWTDDALIHIGPAHIGAHGAHGARGICVSIDPREEHFVFIQDGETRVVEDEAEAEGARLMITPGCGLS